MGQTMLYIKDGKKYVTHNAVYYYFEGTYLEHDYFSGDYCIEEILYKDTPVLCITIYPGVEWDGATFGIDFERVMPATLLHDVLIRDENCPFDRKTIDRFFLYAMKQSGFKLWFLYYFFVKTFRIFFRRG